MVCRLFIQYSKVNPSDLDELLSVVVLSPEFRALLVSLQKQQKSLECSTVLEKLCTTD